MITNLYFKNKLSYVWDADFLAFWARTTSTPDTWMNAYNNVFLNLKARNLFNKSEDILLLCAHNSSDARLNLVSSNHRADIYNSPTFISKQGFTGNGSTSYIDTNWNPALSSLYLQDDATMLVSVETQGSTGAYNAGVYSAGTIAANIPLNNGYVVSCNAGFKTFSAASDYSGVLAVGRNSSSVFQFYIEDGEHEIIQTSTGRPNGNVYLLAINAVPYGVPDGHVNSKISSFFGGAFINKADFAWVLDQFKSDIAAL